MKKHTSEIEIPDRVTKLHQLSYFLLREYMEEEHYKYSRIGKFDIVFENANAYGVGLYVACKVTAKDVYKRFRPKLNSKKRQQFIFIITKHLETVVRLAKD